MTDDEELKIKRLFTAYDKNHDGWISRGEWYDVVHKFLGDKDAAWILAEQPAHMTEDEEAKIQRLFNAYDKDGNGVITRGEWYDVLFKFINDKDAAWILAEKIMDDLDVDPKDEKVTYSEFRAGMKSHWHLFKPKINKKE